MDPDASLQQLLASRRMQEELIRQQQFAGMHNVNTSSALLGEDPSLSLQLYGSSLPGAAPNNSDAAFLALQQRQNLLNPGLLPSSLALQPGANLLSATAAHNPATYDSLDAFSAGQLSGMTAQPGMAGMGMEGFDARRLAAGLPPSAAMSQFNPTNAMAMDGLDARRLAALTSSQQLNPTTFDSFEGAKRSLSSPADLLSTMQQQQQQQPTLNMDGLQGSNNLAGHGFGVGGVGGVPPFPGAVGLPAFQPEPVFDDDDEEDDNNFQGVGGGGVPGSGRLQPVPVAAPTKKTVKRRRKKQAPPAKSGTTAAKSSRAAKAPWRTHKTEGGKQHGKWTREERDAFQACYEKYGKDLEKFLPSIPSRNLKQVQSYYSMYKRHKLSAGHPSPPQQQPRPPPQFAPVVKTAADGETKNRKWNNEERDAFDRAYRKYGKQLEKFQVLIPTRTLKQIKAYFGMYKRYNLTPPEEETTIIRIKRKKKRTNKKPGDKSPAKRAEVAGETATSAEAPPGNMASEDAVPATELSEEEKVASLLVGGFKNPNHSD